MLPFNLSGAVGAEEEAELGTWESVLFSYRPAVAEDLMVDNS